MGKPISEVKRSLSIREYNLFYKYFIHYGIGQEAEYYRSANLIITIIRQMAASAGAKNIPELSFEDIYPQLAQNDASGQSEAGHLVKWKSIPEVTQKELILAGLYTEDGVPTGRGKNHI